jgi:hypothetical protein
MRVYTESPEAQYHKAVDESQHLVGNSNPDSQLSPTTKRLLLSAHLNLVVKKQRRGVNVEQREILQLLPFTISNCSRAKDKERQEPARDEAITWSNEDADWARRMADVGALR